jgi:hypothetical protein
VSQCRLVFLLFFSHIFTTAVSNELGIFLCIVESSRCTFYIQLYYELTASICFEHDLLIFERRSTNNNWRIACVLCLLAAPGAYTYIRVLRWAVNKTLRIFLSYITNMLNSSVLFNLWNASKFRMLAGPKWNGRVWLLFD